MNGLDKSVFSEHSDNNVSIESDVLPSVDQRSVGGQGCLIVKLGACGASEASFAALAKTHFVKHRGATYNKMALEHRIFF